MFTCRGHTFTTAQSLKRHTESPSHRRLTDPEFAKSEAAKKADVAAEKAVAKTEKAKSEAAKKADVAAEKEKSEAGKKADVVAEKEMFTCCGHGFSKLCSYCFM